MISTDDGFATSSAVAGSPTLRFALGLLVAALLTFLTPVGRPKVILYCLRAATGKNLIGVPGNSILDHVSLCDSDKQTLPQMIASASKNTVADFSYGGQTLGETVEYTALELQNPYNRVAILPISLPALSASDDNDLQQYFLFRLLAPSLRQESVWQRLSSGNMLEGQTDPMKVGFTYAGKQYPNYNKLANAYFEKENQKNSCPETNGYNRSFIEAYYDHTYLSFTVPQQNIDLLASLQLLAARHQKRLFIVLMPLDFELMDTMHAGSGEVAKVRAAKVASVLRSQGLNVIDLSASLQNAAFADRYCACGHLNELGRQQVASQVAHTVVADSPSGAQ